jgi:ketosteroid isomerase-like protein
MRRHPMNKKGSVLAIALVFVLGALGSAWAQNVEEQLKKFETDRSAAVVKGDVATVEKGTANDYTFVNVFGQSSDKTQLLNALKSGDIKLTSDDVSDMKVRVYGNTAVITGKADVKGTIGGKDASGQNMFTRVIVKKGGTWQTVALQQTKVSAP